MNLTFLNGIFLAGLAAAAIPVIIHLLQRRRLQRLEFSDLRFLAPLNQQRMRSLNLRRLWLLLLRVLIVALVALAMARPSVRGGLTRLVPTQTGRPERPATGGRRCRAAGCSPSGAC